MPAPSMASIAAFLVVVVFLSTNVQALVDKNEGFVDKFTHDCRVCRQICRQMVGFEHSRDAKCGI
ncbi:MAG TPA: hypothetical protein VE089_00535 [Nitrososphaeraceae archaeon]|nr:hypothetical protein [Nitrososphaeraceae archaeon]